METFCRICMYRQPLSTCGKHPSNLTELRALTTAWSMRPGMDGKSEAEWALSVPGVGDVCCPATGCDALDVEACSCCTEGVLTGKTAGDIGGGTFNVVGEATTYDGGDATGVMCDLTRGDGGTSTTGLVGEDLCDDSPRVEGVFGLTGDEL